MNVINNWFQKFLADKQVVQLFMLLVLAVVFIVVFGSMLAPAIAAVVLAFLLDGSVTWLQDRGLSKNFSVIFVFMGFVTISLIAFFTILPPIMGQFVQFFGLLPTMVASLQEQVVALPEMFPDLIDENQIRTIIDHIRNEFLIVGQHVVEFSLGNIVNLITILVYVVLVPVMVFFFLKDKEEILKWMAKILPTDRQLSTQVWKEVLARTGDYARGKVYEIIIVGVSAWLVYMFLGLQFAAFLALITGLSVIIPYIGAALVTLPVAFVALFQWGAGSESLIAVMAYLILQALDGNVLVPLLFSEVVKLHPNAIILAVLVFGGIWGLWGVFFAIPLATLANAVINAWSTRGQEVEPE